MLIFLKMARYGASPPCSRRHQRRERESRSSPDGEKSGLRRGRALLVPALVRPPSCHISAFKTPTPPSKNQDEARQLILHHLLLPFVLKLLLSHSQISFILHAHLSLNLSSTHLPLPLERFLLS